MRFSSALEKVFSANIRYAEDVYCAHEDIVDRVSTHRPFPKSEPVLFPNAVDPNEFEPVSAGRLRERLSIPDSKFVVGFVGSLKDRHRIEELVRAVAMLPEDVHFLIVGNGPERDCLERLASKLEISHRVIFTGFVDHDTVPEYVSACDVAYGVKDPNNPSNPIKIYEYLACETPVITSQSPEFEFVSEQDAGVVIDAITPEEIATAIQELRARPNTERRQMGERGRTYVVENHTWDQLVEFVVERNL
jgi:glycosyltransferase involved in cell wall biosynthesis